MNVVKVGPQGYRGLGAPARSASTHARDTREATRAESRARTDTVEISTQARAPIEEQAERIGLLPQLVVRMTTRLRTSFMERSSAATEAPAPAKDSDPSRTEPEPEGRATALHEPALRESVPHGPAPHASRRLTAYADPPAR